MKTIKKEIKLDNLSMELSTDYEGYFHTSTKDDLKEVKYTFILPYFIYPKNKNVKLVYEDIEPETLTEFLEDKHINKKELVKWLNENYK